jgi:type IV pilus assembly protein PilA
MINKMRKMDKQGFTLIELMIVIAIIGILAAIAIPNFIAYRNKSFCSAAESDANQVASRVSDYYSIPTRTKMIQPSDIGGNTIMSHKNTFTFANTSSPNSTITIEVTDASGRCPSDYQNAMSATQNPKGYWSNNVYYKAMD